MPEKVCVEKRNGSFEEVSFDKILTRVQNLSEGLSVDPVRVAQRTVQGVYNGVKTSHLDDLAAETSAGMATQHPDYSLLAGRISVSNLHKMTSSSVLSVKERLSEDVLLFVETNIHLLDGAMDHTRDFSYDYFAFKTLEKSYLLRRMNGVGSGKGPIIERPQVMLMRVSCGIHCGDLASVLETYDLLSRGAFTHATPTMFNAGTPSPHLSSCFLLPVEDDSVEGIYDTLKQCALISKSAGGIGISVSNVRCEGSLIHSTGGYSNGLVPMLRCYESTARHVDQGGGKRKGAFAAYLEPWHPDVLSFLDMKKNHGVEERRARDLFYALWIPDIFMERVRENGDWPLFCPSSCPDLVDLHGESFTKRYVEYENAGAAHSVIRAQKVWFSILDSQVETGTPYMLYKDSCNKKSNHSHLGTIRSSNLCTEIIQFSSCTETAVCNLGSLSLPFFLDNKGEEGREVFSLEKLESVVSVLTRNLDRVIDRNAYTRIEAELSNLRHRPMGIGVQGLADVFARLEIPFDSEEAKKLNRDIFESIYLSAVRTSVSMAKEKGTYPSYPGSEASMNRLQFDLWGHTPPRIKEWEEVKENLKMYGLRNSLLVAPMPTASTAQILGNNECFEPFTSNLYTRRVLAGEFAVVNKHLVRRLEKEGMWNEDTRRRIIASNGSVQGLDFLSDQTKKVYRTAWEMSMRSLIDMSAERAPFVDQSQSLNLFVESPTHEKLTSMHFYAWGKGLKTGMYYLRTRPAADAVKVTLPVDVCKRDDPDCVLCSS